MPPATLARAVTAPSTSIVETRCNDAPVPSPRPETLSPALSTRVLLTTLPARSVTSLTAATWYSDALSLMRNSVPTWKPSLCQLSPVRLIEWGPAVANCTLPKTLDSSSSSSPITARVLRSVSLTATATPAPMALLWATPPAQLIWVSRLPA